MCLTNELLRHLQNAGKFQTSGKRRLMLNPLKCRSKTLPCQHTASAYGRQNFDLSGNYCVQRKKDGMFPFRPDFPTLHYRVTFGVFNNFENFHFVARAAVDVDKVLT